MENGMGESSVTAGEHGTARVHLGDRSLSLADLDKALGQPVEVTVDDGCWQRMERGAVLVRAIARGDAPAYGINTGFGHLCNKRIAGDQLERLQENLIVSHAVGVGPAMPGELVRWLMLFKIHALTRGVSGVTPETVRCLLHMLNHDLLPHVPTQGSLGASGDLAPLAHMVLPMLGQGTVRRGQEDIPATQALGLIGMKPIRLGPKEGLALINGTQFMTSYAAAIAIRARRLAKHADIIASVSLEGFCGSLRPFDERLHALRPHPGSIKVASNVRRLMADSQILASHVACDRVQDPYSLRCVPQVHGASRDTIEHAACVIETEINAVTDNPLIFEPDEVISGGNFHGQPLALVLDFLTIALAELASISERRTYLLLNGEYGLPKLLMRNTGLNSGFMLPQYTSAALVSENKVLSSPASVDSIPTSLGQEDHVSMGAIAATKCWRVLENCETVLAIELLCATQAVDYRDPLKPGVGPEIARDIVRQVVPHAEEDRLFGDDIKTSLKLLRSQRILQGVETRIETLA